MVDIDKEEADNQLYKDQDNLLTQMILKMLIIEIFSEFNKLHHLPIPHKSGNDSERVSMHRNQLDISKLSVMYKPTLLPLNTPPCIYSTLT